MTDRYQPLRDAIAAGPTKGPWKSMPVRSGYYIQSASEPAVVVDSTDAEGRYGAIANAADAALIAAADPSTIAELLAERDHLADECHEQARLLGMSGSREAKLLAERDALKSDLDTYMRIANEEANRAASLEADAARYRFLAARCRSTAEHWGGRWSIVIDGPAPRRHDDEDDFDAAIDAAMEASNAG